MVFWSGKDGREVILHLDTTQKVNAMSIKLEGCARNKLEFVFPLRYAPWGDVVEVPS